ncbi:MAG: DUF4129 domain-containing protein [Acidobacteriaceae bacterium]
MGRFEAQNGSRMVGRRRPWLVLVALGLAVLGPARGWAAGIKDVSGDGFRADVTRLQGVVEQCAAAAGGCAVESVGEDVRVGDVAKGGYEEHWDWLRRALKDAKTAKGGGRATLMREAGARLQMMAEESGAAGEKPAEIAREQAMAHSVLAQPQFQGVAGLTWWDRLKMTVEQWLQRFFDGLVDVGAAAPWMGPVLEWLCYVGAAVGVLFFLLRNLARRRLKVVLGGEALRGSGWENESNEWAEWAAQHAEAGEWREAVHCLYWGAIVLLESRRAWRHNPTRTPREYVRLLKAGSAQQTGLRRLTQIFERVWYGLREADEQEYAEARGLYERLAANAGEAGGALAAGGAA